MGPHLRAAVLVLVALAAVGAAQDARQPHNAEEDTFHTAFQGRLEQTVPQVGQQRLISAGSDVLKVPARSPPTRVAQDAVVLPVDTAAGFAGRWDMVSENSGVSAMHLVVMRHGKAIMFDTTTTGPSLLSLPQGRCRPDPRSKPPGAMDCWAHAVEFDYNTGALRSLRILTDTWCSSGALDADGNLVQTGGYFEGAKAVRYLKACDNCDWNEFPNSFAQERWYATQVALPDGRFIVVGGRRSFSYEFVPAAGQSNARAIPLQLLRATTDVVENNLYPFVHLLADGTLFVFANDRSIVLDPRTGAVLRELPVLPGGGRNYPASAMSALLPIDLRRRERTDPEVIVCGGAPKNAFTLGETNTFLPAIRSCARINPSRPAARWTLDLMPVGRTMGDMLLLPTGDLLMLNGAARGCSGWGFGRQPVLSPVLYSPRRKRGSRFRALAATAVPRMYHASSAVLPDATVLVAGSNTNPAYNFTRVDFPTEVRVERFSPPYLAPGLLANRPAIDAASVPPDGMRYGARLTLRFSTPAQPVAAADVKVTMYAPPFTTHGYSMNQRLLVLPVTSFVAKRKVHTITVDPPAKPELAPPGYYMVFVLAKGVPSKAAWIKIHK